MNPTIQLRSGAYFNFTKPETTPLSISDIAWGLSRICRYTGHCDGGPDDHIYSVLQHTLLVMDLVGGDREIQLEAALHDAAEAVLGDVSKPLKMLLPDYQAIEARVERAVRVQYGLPAEPHRNMELLIKYFDAVALKVEKRCLMPVGSDDSEWEWNWLRSYHDPGTVVVPRHAEGVRNEFLSRLELLGVRA